MKRFFNRKILEILGIIIVLFGIPLAIFVLKNQTALKSRASNSQAPQDVKITNISDQSFTVTYQTELPSTGSISYGTTKMLGQSELDDIDKEKGSFIPKKIHRVSVRKLTPSTKYYFTIISGSDTFLNNNFPFETVTGINISSPSVKQSTIKGKILLPNGNAPLEAIVYLNAQNSQLLSSTVANDGTFSFSLNELRTADLSSYFNSDNETSLKIFATNGSLKSNVAVTAIKTGSVPTITLSNDYDFTNTNSQIASDSAGLSGFPSISPTTVNPKPQILTPKKDQSFIDQKPQFSGTSLPNEKVEITIHSDEQITTQVTADSNGNWTYKPPNDLSPGTHTITISTRDLSGILTTITQSFTVFASESQASQSSTPSATPTPIITSPQIPTPTTAIFIPTSTPTPLPSPTPVFIGSELPPTGNPSTFLIIGGIAATISGLVLFLLTHAIL